MRNSGRSADRRIPIFVASVMVLMLLVASVSVLAAAHDADGKSIVDKVVKEGVEYELYDDGTAKATGTVAPTPVSLTISDTVEGKDGKEYKVTSITSLAFVDHTFAGDLVIPSNVVSIENDAFYNCDFDGRLILNDGLERIGKNAFYYCNFKGDLEIPSSVISIGDCAFSAYFSGHLKLGNGLERIGDCAFFGCSFTGDLEIPSTVTSIGESAFHGCEFRSLTILGGNIGKNAFELCENVENVSIAKGVSADSSAFPFAFYDKNGKVLERGEIGEKYYKKASGKMTEQGGFFTVSFDMDGGSPVFPNVYMKDGGTYTLPSDTPKKEGYLFKGWECNGTKYLPKQQISVYSSIAFKAMWEPKTETVHFVLYDVDGGSPGPRPFIVKEGDTFKVASYDGTKAGYKFGGWSYNGHVYKAGDTITMGDSDIKLKAVWEKNPGYFGDMGLIISIAVAIVTAIVLIGGVVHIIRRK